MSLPTDQTDTGLHQSAGDATPGSLPCIVPLKYRKTSSGVSLVVRGHGTPVFLMHGIGGNAGSCSALARALSLAGYMTICWDAPGYGKSDDPAGEIDHSEIVLNALSEMGIDSVHLVGTSWGGVIATRLAAAHPHLIRSMVLLDSTRGSGRSAESARKMLDRLPELEALGAEAFAAKRAARLVSPDAPAEMVIAVRRDMEQIRPSGYGAAARMMAATDTTVDLKRISVPTIVLVGEHDIITGVEESSYLARAIPGARFAVIGHAGHAAIQEKPNEAAALILSFWKNLP